MDFDQEVVKLLGFFFHRNLGFGMGTLFSGFILEISLEPKLRVNNSCPEEIW